MTVAPDSADASDSYLYPPVNYFWRWEEAGTVAVWADGRTIAFATELSAILDHLKQHELPPLGALLLVMAACRQDWPNDQRSIGILQGLIPNNHPEREAKLAQLQRVAGCLDSVQRVPANYRAGSRNKMGIIGIIFERLHDKLSKQAEGVLAGIVVGASGAKVQSPISAAAQLFYDLNVLETAFKDFNPASVPWRLDTGVDGPPKAAEPQGKPQENESFREMLDRLGSQPEFSTVIGFARQLAAATYLPRPLSAPDDQSQGGVSDIANRGNLDRLLITELAADDLVLAVRVALKEALYLRHEVAPRPPNTKRVLLIDTGVRMWGSRRIAAVALALAMAEDEDVETECFALNGIGFEAAQLNSESGLRALLAHLSPTATPIQAVASFAISFQSQAEDCELILITSAQVADHHRLADAMKSKFGARRIVAGISRDGRVEASTLGEFGRQTLFHCQLVTPTAAPKQPKIPTPTGPADPDFPDIFSCRPFPFRLPHPKAARTTILLPDSTGAVGVTPDSRLLYWDQPRLGAIQLADRLRTTQIWLMDFYDDWVVLVLHRRGDNHLWLHRYKLDGSGSFFFNLGCRDTTILQTRLLIVDREIRVHVETARHSILFDMMGAQIQKNARTAEMIEQKLLNAQRPNEKHSAYLSSLMSAHNSIIGNVDRIAVDEASVLSILSRSSCWDLIYEKDDDVLRFVRVPKNLPSGYFVKLAQPRPSIKRGYGMRMGSRDGVSIIVDRRGLLHLFDAENGLRQVSIVMTQGKAAAITRDGRFCGPEGFYFAGQRVSAGEVWEEICGIVGGLTP